jgi:hypothetical protein
MDAIRGVDPRYRTFVSYIDKSREFYEAQGFTDPYRWAHFEDVSRRSSQSPTNVTDYYGELAFTGTGPAPPGIYSMP